jgi:hypothetical protein
MMDEDWHGFAAAFTEAVRRDEPGNRRGVRRMLTVGLATVVVMALGALANGAFGLTSAGRESPHPAAAAPAATASAGAAPLSGRSTWSAVTGPGCDSTATASGVSGRPGDTATFSVYGYDTARPAFGRTGWTSATGGGYRGRGCPGGLLTMPVSGSAKTYDDDRFALWSFDFASGPRSADCDLSTWVPARSTAPLDPAYYLYWDAAYSYGSQTAPRGGFTVRPGGGHAGWRRAETVHTDDGRITVELVDAGADGTQATADAHLTVPQLRLSCRAA